MRIRFRRSLIIAMLLIIAILSILAACSSTQTSTTSPTTTTAPINPSVSAAGTPSSSTSSSASSTSNAIIINQVAQNIAFNTSTITVPPGADVTVNFDNKDSGIPHSFSVYTNSSATTAIFIGKVITGPATTTYTFKTPTTPGKYFFRCDVHPTIMTGQFIVQ